MKLLKYTFEGILAGMCISLGGIVFLACENKVVGAIFFSVALLCICLKGYSLYTGRIGFIPQSHKKEDVSSLLLGLLGNAIGTFLLGYLVVAAIPSIGEAALKVCEAKLTQSLFSTFVRGFFCGILMYLAVSIYREQKTVVGIVFCIPVFILSGFEHSIADMFYFGASGIVSVNAFVFIWNVILGNTVGAIIPPILRLVCERGKTE